MADGFAKLRAIVEIASDPMNIRCLEKRLEAAEYLPELLAVAEAQVVMLDEDGMALDISDPDQPESAVGVQCGSCGVWRAAEDADFPTLRHAEGCPLVALLAKLAEAS